MQKLMALIDTKCIDVLVFPEACTANRKVSFDSPLSDE